MFHSPEEIWRRVDFRTVSPMVARSEEEHVEEAKEHDEEKSEISVASAEEESESEEDEGTEYSSAEPEEPEEKLELEESSDDDTLSKEQLQMRLSWSRKMVRRKKKQLNTAQEKVEKLKEELEREEYEVESLVEKVKELEKQEKIEKQANKKQANKKQEKIEKPVSTRISREEVWEKVSYSGKTVHRFWYHVSHTPQDFAPALSWAGYHQIIYTNRVDDNSWTRLGTNITILPIPDFVDPDLCAEYQKDEWQFGIVKGAPHAVLCVDWDFYLIKDLPDTATILISEWTKASGGLVPKNTLRPGSSTRLHLGITKFEANDPIADEIYNMFVATRKACQGITKTSAKWMKHTEHAQDIVKKHKLSVFDPIYFNPYPVWMKKPHHNKLHYGVLMPDLLEVEQMTYAFTSWEGHAFCELTLNRLRGLCSAVSM